VNVRYQLVIFDMDGTLTEELLDFDAIRRDIGAPAKAPILEFMSTLEPARRRRAEEILHQHEMTAALACALHDGAADVLKTLRGAGVTTALLTRNSRACAEAVLGRHALTLDLVHTRDNEPHKPHGDSILNICRAAGIEPQLTLMVGDYLYDLQAAANAGVDAALLCAKLERPAFATMARYCVSNLREIVTIVSDTK